MFLMHLWILLSWRVKYFIFFQIESDMEPPSTPRSKADSNRTSQSKRGTEAVCLCSLLTGAPLTPDVPQRRHISENLWLPGQPLSSLAWYSRAFIACSCQVPHLISCPLLPSSHPLLDAPSPWRLLRFPSTPLLSLILFLLSTLTLHPQALSLCFSTKPGLRVESNMGAGCEVSTYH